MLDKKYLFATIIIMLKDKPEAIEIKKHNEKSFYSEDILAIINNQYKVSNFRNSKTV